MDKQVKPMHQHMYMCVCVSALPGAKTCHCLLQALDQVIEKKKQGRYCFVSFNNMNAFNVLIQMSPASLSKFAEFHITPTLLPL